MKQVIIIGGSDAGISAALRAKELRPDVNVTVVAADRYPNFSICGLPFLLSGEVEDWQTLAHRTAAEIEREGIRLMLERRATAIDPESREVSVAGRDGKADKLAYDRLVIGTGAVSVRPPIDGVDLPGVYLLRWMDDAFAMLNRLKDRHRKTALIVGAGYIGMEMADALTYRGMEVTVVEFADSVLTTVDPEFGQRIRTELEEHGVRVATGVTVSRIERSGDGLVVHGAGSFEAAADIVLVAVGARPQADLAHTAGVELGTKGAIKVDRFMRTNVAGIYAAGDCVETWHRLLQQSSYLPLGTTAHKQGRVAGENAVGGSRLFEGSLGTQSVKIFDLVAARTGLRDGEAAAAGFDAVTVALESWDHKVYYPGARKMWIRVTGDRTSGRLLGAQILGHRGSEVSKRIDIFASALYNKMQVDELNDLDLSYTPPLSSPWDPVQMSAQAWCRQVG